MIELKFDWTYFKRRIYIKNCSKEEIFRKLVTPKGLTEWFIAEATYSFDNGKIRLADEIVKAGDNYLWKFHNDSIITGKVLEVKENYKFKFTFGKKEPDSNEDVIVTFTITERENDLLFDILQENMANNKYGKVMYYISCNMGWVFHMNNLKAIYENRYDLRVKGTKRMHVDAPSGYPLNKYQWTEFKQKEYIRAKKEFIFRKWATANGITEWFIAEATYVDETGKKRENHEMVQAKDSYEWKFYSGLIMKGQILDVVENEKIIFTFGKKTPDSDEDIIVTVTFTDIDNVTLIELVQENIADNEYGHVTYNLSCILGWSYFMTNLRSIIEFRYDLREKNQKIALESRAYSLN